jgi:hypothetical protein
VFAGALCAALIRDGQWRVLWSGLLLSTAASVLVLVRGLPMIGFHERLLPSFAGETALGAFYARQTLAATRVPVAFWNHTPFGCLGSLLPLLASAVACVVLARRAPRSLWVRGGALLGRHALFAYLCHLAILGAADALALSPRRALATWLWVAASIAVSMMPWVFGPAPWRARGAFHTRS